MRVYKETMGMNKTYILGNLGICWVQFWGYIANNMKHTHTYIYHTIWLFNVAMENQHVLMRKSTCLSSMCMGHGFHVG